MNNKPKKLSLFTRLVDKVKHILKKEEFEEYEDAGDDLDEQSRCNK